jgi:hypothetical protein
MPKTCTLKIDRSNSTRWKREIWNGLRMMKIENVVDYCLESRDLYVTSHVIIFARTASSSDRASMQKAHHGRPEPPQSEPPCKNPTVAGLSHLVSEAQLPTGSGGPSDRASMHKPHHGRPEPPQSEPPCKKPTVAGLSHLRVSLHAQTPPWPA